MSSGDAGGSVASAAEGAALTARLDALEDVLLLLERHDFVLPEGVGDDRIAHARGRLRHGSEHTVVALVGSTGSGKSSLLNTLVGEEVARAGVTRPTTSVTQAATIGTGAGGLLDLIGVSRRHQVTGSPSIDGGASRPLDGLVLLDLPDFDSVTVAHRLEVDRLITLVDMLVWVTDPQKYADASLHDGYLRRLSGHADVMQVVLNKTDTVPAGELDPLLADLSRLLRADGLGSLDPIATSTMTEGGVDVLRGVLAGEVAARRAAIDRIDADLRSQAQALRELTGTAERAALTDRQQSEVADSLAAAAGLDHVAALVAAQHRRDATLATGWPPLRFLRRLRRAPLGRLEPAAGSQVATAEVSRTLRSTAAIAAGAVGPCWADAAVSAVRGQLPGVTAALDRAVSRDVQHLRQPPRWWTAVGWVHRLLLLTAVIGGVWLLGILAAQAFLLLDVEPYTPRVGTVPLPTTLLLIGGAGGALLGLVSRLAARVTSARQGRRATASLRRAVAGVTEEEVIAPLQTVLADRAQVADLIDVVAGTGGAGGRGGSSR